MSYSIVIMCMLLRVLYTKDYVVNSIVVYR